MLDIFLKIYDGIFPQPEPIKRLKRENEKDFIKYFSPHRFTNCIVLSDYTESGIKAAITANKFHDHEPASLLLARLVEHWLKTLPPRPTIFVPVPLSDKRQKSRGYNQVRRVLEKIRSDEVQIEDILVRTKDTKPQTSLGRDERFKNVEGIFSYQTNIMLSENIRIVLVDDVVTTGATMLSAHGSLTANLTTKHEIICLALAH